MALFELLNFYKNRSEIPLFAGAIRHIPAIWDQVFNLY